MNRFAELDKLRKEISDDGTFRCIGGESEGVDYNCLAEHALPWLLTIAEAFRPGDAQRLALLILNEQRRWTDERWQAAIDCLRRLQAAAEELER